MIHCSDRETEVPIPCQCKWFSREQMLIPACHRDKWRQRDPTHGAAWHRFPGESSWKWHSPQISSPEFSEENQGEQGSRRWRHRACYSFVFTEISEEISTAVNGVSTVFSIFNQESVNQASPSFLREDRSLACSFGFNTIIPKFTLASWTERT